MNNKKYVDGIHVYDYKRLCDEPSFFGGYKEQISTAMAIASNSIKREITFNTLIFGPPGTGKNVFPRHIASKTILHHKKTVFINVDTPVLMSLPNVVPRFLESIEQEFSNLTSGSLLILALEDVEILSKRGTHDSASLLYAITNIVDAIQDSAPKKKTGATLFFSSNYPSQIDAAILGRVHYAIYFPPSSLEEINEILDHFDVPQPERVAQALTTKLAGKPISGKGLIIAGENIRRLNIKYGDDIWKNADLLLANAIILQRAESIREYQLENEHYIEKSRSTQDFWREERFR